jgi:hypothetical protein
VDRHCEPQAATIGEGAGATPQEIGTGQRHMTIRTAAELSERLAAHGLLLRGGFELDPVTDGALLEQFQGRRQLLLIGNVGSAIWPYLHRFMADHPAASDPLDQWTEIVLQAVAGEIGAVSLFPFGGPPWWPFQQWAKRADAVSPSPVAILIHPIYGLWHAYRGALLLEEPIALPPRSGAPSPCDSCIERPCLSACPVGAFSASGYDVDGCARHVNGAAGHDCQTRGCLARLACPVGPEYRYDSAHAAFHMAAFRRSHP